MPFCTTCGANVDGAFCGRCGTPVSAGQSAPPPPNRAQANTYGPQPVGPGAGLPPAAPRRMNGIVLALLIVCGLIFVCIAGLVGFGIFAARQFRNNPGALIARIVSANPNLEVVHTDNGAGTITIRDRRTGKQSTISFDQVRRRGRFSITADDDNGGKASVQFGDGAADLPSWVPKYPGAAESGTFSAKGADSNGNGEGGSFNFSTPDPARKVMDFYQRKAGELGMKINLSADNGDGGTIVAVNDDNKRTLTVTATGSGNSTNVNVVYASKD